MLEHADKDNFLYQKRTYRGQFHPSALLFNANLQEFATRVSYISNLQTLGKLSPEESYEQIEALWNQLKSSYAALGLDSTTLN
ncbi:MULTISPECIES: DUF7219 family protein [Nostocales]|uniref:Isopropylmalate/homocitrate/citramalate synthase n=2 Tax=Nostocales TaxID=1161 RepID=A0A0C1NCL0_9CYAN|nr:hypothetical protein [Tolypothrix bouteillei]KAF3886442.1 hypothetical protein DA73_0400013870 [Tolypothrix bouteillei VB521301]